MKVSAELWSADRCGNRKFASEINSQRFTNVRTQKDLKLYLIPNNHHLVKLVCAQNQSHASVTSSAQSFWMSVIYLYIYLYETNWTLITWGQEVTPISDTNTPDQKNWTGTATQQWWVKWPLLPLTFLTFVEKLWLCVKRVKLHQSQQKLNSTRLKIKGHTSAMI